MWRLEKKITTYIFNPRYVHVCLRCEYEYSFCVLLSEISWQRKGLLDIMRDAFLDSLVALSNPEFKTRRFPISVLMRYSLGMPETSLSGRNTRIARNVRRSISSCMPCEHAVMILPQKHTHPPHFTTYYSITLILTLLLNT